MQSERESETTVTLTHPQFRNVATTGIWIFVVLLVVTLALPVLDQGGLLPGEKSVLPGFIWFFAATFLPPASIANGLLILSSLLLLRRYNGLVLMRSLVVSMTWLSYVYFALTFPRTLYVGFYCWFAAMTLAVVAHWITWVGTTRRFCVAAGDFGPKPKG